MNALVTGGTGFIGSRVVDFLIEKGHAVRLFSRKTALPSRLADKDVTLFPGDLRDPQAVFDAMAGMDVIYHIGEVRNTSPAAARRNVRLVEGMIERLDSARIRRIVFVSSITVAGIPGKTPADEKTERAIPLRDHYTRYKEQSENILAAKKGAAEYAVVRPGVVYGPGSRYLGRLIRAIDLMRPVGLPFIGKGAAIAPLVYVKDVARAVYLAGTEPDAANQVFNVTAGARDSWRDFFQAIATALGKNIRILPVPSLLLRPPSWFLDALAGMFGVRFGLDAYVRYVTSDILFDNDKARRFLHWSPEYSLARGAAEMVLDYKVR